MPGSNTLSGVSTRPAACVTLKSQQLQLLRSQGDSREHRHVLGGSGAEKAACAAGERLGPAQEPPAGSLVPYLCSSASSPVHIPGLLLFKKGPEEGSGVEGLLLFGYPDSCCSYLRLDRQELRSSE